MPASAIAVGFCASQIPATPSVTLRLRPTPWEALEEAVDLDNVPKQHLESGLNRLLRDIESFQEPERWDGMS
jgi:hypothetical protein